MKLKIEIPKGWVVVKTGFKTGDRFSMMSRMTWVRFTKQTPLEAVCLAHVVIRRKAKR